MGLETVTHISDLVITNPVGSTDLIQYGDDHIRNIKIALKTDFPNITGPITATQAEINVLDGYTGNTNDLNILAGAAAAGLTAAELLYVATATSDLQTQMNGKMVGSNNLSEITTAATARTNLGLGALAVLATVDQSTIDANSIRDSHIYWENITTGTSSANPWTPAAGLYVMVNTGSTTNFEIYVSAAWRTAATAVEAKTFFTDGTNVRFSGGGATYYYIKLA